MKRAIAVVFVILTMGFSVPATLGATTSAVITAAGDISCTGTFTVKSTSCQQMATSNLVLNAKPNLALTLGDNAYDGTLAGYQSGYAQSWGRFLSITRPIPGPHDWHSFPAGIANGAGYCAYFGALAHCPTGYYSYNVGNWHVVAVNASVVHGLGTAQEKWFKADLAANTRSCILIQDHEPRFSSGLHGSYTGENQLWLDASAAHATLWLSGANHDYERFSPLSAAGTPVTRGITEFVIGTGGDSLNKWINAPLTGEKVRNNTTFGIGVFTLASTGWSMHFTHISGKTFTDSASGTC